MSWRGPATDMNSMPQPAVTNGYRNIEYLRPQFSTASTVVVMNESPPWRRNSSARASFTRLASSRDTGLGIARRIESTGIARLSPPGGQTRTFAHPTVALRGLPWTIALSNGEQIDRVGRAPVHRERRGARR